MSLIPFFIPSADVSYRYLRIDITAVDGGVFLCIQEMKWFVGAVDYPTVAMTSDTAPSPLVASGTGAYVSGDDPYEAYDNTTGKWQPDSGTAHSLTIDLGAGNGILPTSVKITAHATVPARSPKDFTLEGSNTGAFAGEEVVLLTNTGTTGWTNGEEKTFTI